MNKAKEMSPGRVLVAAFALTTVGRLWSDHRGYFLCTLRLSL